MPFQITEVRHTAFPAADVVESALVPFGLSTERIRQLLDGFTCSAPIRERFGYQQSLSDELQRYLREELTRDGSLVPAIDSYSPILNERADLAIERPGNEGRVYFELEFRPNVEKDLVKFKIGYNNRFLHAGVLVVAIDRRAINASYTTMPEYGKFVSVIQELKPEHPLLLIGINGHFSE